MSALTLGSQSNQGGVDDSAAQCQSNHGIYQEADEVLWKGYQKKSP